MATSAHVRELRKKHQALSQQVETEERNPGIDPLYIKALKKQKLDLKQQIARLDTV